jgi:hypothetical protein
VALRAAGALLATLPAGHDLLFLIRADGRLDPATRRRMPTLRDGDTVVALSDDEAVG